MRTAGTIEKLLDYLANTDFPFRNSHVFAFSESLNPAQPLPTRTTRRPGDQKKGKKFLYIYFFVFFVFFSFLKGFRALFDGLGWYLDDLGWFGQNLEILKKAVFFQFF